MTKIKYAISTVCYRLRIQLVDATHSWNRCAGVWKSRVPNDQLKRLRRDAESVRLPVGLAGQGHVLALQCQRQQASA